MKLVFAATTVVAAILAMSLAPTSAAPAEHSSDHGRRMLLSSPSGNTKPSESMLRWLLFRSRLADKVVGVLALSLTAPRHSSDCIYIRFKEKAKNGGPFFQLSKTAHEYNLKPKLQLQGTANSDEEIPNGDEDFSDDDIQYLLPEGRQAVKRQPDDYGHMRFGKRDFDDYGHMRFGRR